MLSLAAISISGMLLTSNIPSDSYSKQREGCFSAIHRMQYTNRKENICFFSENEINTILNQFDYVEGSFSIRQYLAENNFILDLLLQSVVAFKKYYSSETTFSISLLDNSDEGEQSQIRIVAQSSEAIDSLFEKLNNFFDSWWINQVQKSEGKIIFGIG